MLKVIRVSVTKKQILKCYLMKSKHQFTHSVHNNNKDKPKSILYSRKMVTMARGFGVILACCIVIVGSSMIYSANGQPGGGTNVKELIQESYTKDAIIPDLLTPEQQPLSLLELKWAESRKKISYFGAELTPSDVKTIPRLAANLGDVDGVDDSSYYTLILTDPDAPSRANPTKREWLHWIVKNVRITNKRRVDVKGGNTVVEYVSSAPPPDSGKHRYVFLLFEQSDGFVDCSNEQVLIAHGGGGKGRANFNTQKYIKDNNLGRLIASNYYFAEYDDYVPKVYEMLNSKKDL